MLVVVWTDGVCLSVWQSSMNAMGSLSVLSPDRVLPQLISTITASVQNPALCLVTREEFSIMQTPAGELFDKSIIQRWGSAARLSSLTSPQLCFSHLFDGHRVAVKSKPSSLSVPGRHTCLCPGLVLRPKIS
jgi:hypothetical protein